MKKRVESEKRTHKYETRIRTEPVPITELSNIWNGSLKNCFKIQSSGILRTRATDIEPTDGNDRTLFLFVLLLVSMFLPSIVEGRNTKPHRTISPMFDNNNGIIKIVIFFFKTSLSSSFFQHKKHLKNVRSWMVKEKWTCMPVLPSFPPFPMSLYKRELLN